MSTPKKEVIKAIYIKIANDELEFITISNKSELQSKIEKVRLSHPTHEIVTKTFMQIEDEPQPKFYKFSCEIINGDFIAKVIPCSKNATFNVRHIAESNIVVITLDAINEDEALKKAHELHTVLYAKKYIK